VIQHDLNVYDVLTSIGLAGVKQSVTQARPADASRLDYSMLDVEPIDPGREKRRWVNLDIQTALCLMNIPFALCLTFAEYRTAVHSLRLDETVLALLADITGDEAFLRWRPGTLTIRADSSMDVPRAVYEHAVICEYAHAHLIRLGHNAVASPESYVDR